MPEKITLPMVKKLLEEGLPWPKELPTEHSYTRLHDDHDGTMQGTLCVYFNRVGDAYISTDLPGGKPLRFRTDNGGGNSVRVRNALVLLALACKWDSEGRLI